jgi:hypothetical protein
MAAQALHDARAKRLGRVDEIAQTLVQHPTVLEANRKWNTSVRFELHSFINISGVPFDQIPKEFLDELREKHGFRLYTTETSSGGIDFPSRERWVVVDWSKPPSVGAATRVTASTQPRAAPAAEVLPPYVSNEEGLCRRCKMRIANTLVMPCGCSCLCGTCSDELAKTSQAYTCYKCKNSIDIVCQDGKEDRVNPKKMG